MSKSKYNGISPITLTEKYGSDALRLALFSVPYDKDIDFTEAEVKHKLDFMNRVFDILPKIK
jgi:leucyl-tRNA synthetase